MTTSEGGRWVAAVLVALVLLTRTTSALGGDEMRVQALGGAPGLFVQGEPVPALMGSPAGAAMPFCVRDGALHFQARGGGIVELFSKRKLPPSFAVEADVTLTRAMGDDSNISLSVNVTNEGRQRYAYYLNAFKAGNRLVLARFSPASKKMIDVPYPWTLGQTVRLKVVVDGGRISAFADGKPLGTVDDPSPLAPGALKLSAYSTEGAVDNLRVTAPDSAPLLADDFSEGRSSQWEPEIPPYSSAPSFAQIGVHLYTEGCGDLRYNWKGPGQYDWRSVDYFLECLAEVDPEARLLARFNVNAPAWWIKAHPQDVMICYGQNPAEPIQGKMASFSSTSWRRDAAEALRDLLRHLKQSPNGHRVAGITICGGVSAEWVYAWNVSFHDYSPVQLAAFRDWLRNRYGSVEKLRSAWNDKDVTFETAAIPTPQRRMAGDFYEFFDPAKGRQVPDYMRFHSEAVSGALLHFARVVKETAGPGMLTAVFYGYHFHAYEHYQNIGHHDLAAVLKSPHIDAICCPHDYANRQAGGVTIPVLPVDSVRLHGKLWFDEDDTRTHLSSAASSYGRTSDAWETLNVLRRNFAHAISKSAGLWHMDWSNGWYCDPEVMQGIAAHVRIARTALKKDRRPNAEIAVVISEDSLDCLRSSYGIVRTISKSQYFDHMPRIGAPFDTILVSDLAVAPEYKLYIFLDTFYITDAQKAVIKEKVLGNGHAVLWLFGPGFVTDKGLSAPAMGELTGIDLDAYDGGGRLRLTPCDLDHPITRGVMPGMQFETLDETGPIFYSRDSRARVLGMTHVAPCTNSSGVFKSGSETMPGLVVKEMKDWRSIWCAVPAVPPVLLRNISRSAGVHIYTDGDDVVYANRFMLSIVGRYAGERVMRLPAPMTVTDAFTGRVLATKASQFKVYLKRNETGFWYLD